MEYSNAIRTIRLQAGIDKMNAIGSSASSSLLIYGGTIPNYYSAITGAQKLLVTIPMARPVSSEVVNGTATMNDLPETMIMDSGLATFARIIDADGGTVAQLGMSELNPDLTGAVLNFQAGAYIRVEGWTLSDS